MLLVSVSKLRCRSNLIYTFKLGLKCVIWFHVIALKILIMLHSANIKVGLTQAGVWGV